MVASEIIFCFKEGPGGSFSIGKDLPEAVSKTISRQGALSIRTFRAADTLISVAQICLEYKYSNTVDRLVRSSEPCYMSIGRWPLPKEKFIIYCSEEDTCYDEQGHIAYGKYWLHYKGQKFVYEVPSTPLLNSLQSLNQSQLTYKLRDLGFEVLPILMPCEGWGPIPQTLVQPGTQFCDYIRLLITCKRFGKLARMTVEAFITAVDIKIWELTTSIKFSKTEGISFDNHVYHKKVLQKNCLCEWSKPLAQALSGAVNHVRLPDSLYDFTIPQLGPTFFASQSMRSYAVQIGIHLQINGTPVYVTDSIEIIVVAPKSTREGCDQTDSILGGYEKPTFNAVDIQYLPEREYDSFANARAVFEKACQAKHQYMTHMTSTSQAKNGTFMVSVIDMLVSKNLDEVDQKSLSLVISKYGLDGFGRYSTVPTEQASVVCEVTLTNRWGPYYDNGLLRTRGKLFLRLNSKGFDFVFPPRLLGHSLTSNTAAVCPQKDIEGWLLRASRQFHYQFDDRLGYILVPGMKLFKAFDIWLHFNTIPDTPYSWDCINKNPVSVLVQIEELVTGSPSNFPASRRLTQTLIDKIYGGKGSEECWIWPDSDSNTCKILSPFLDCQIPDLGPTFFTNEVSRTYKLFCHFEFAVNSGRTIELSIILPIAIAVDNCGVEKSVPPPQYSAEASSECSLPSKN
ncbi:hypothetical protein FT663_01996 [Candidozyma haemuli var. vulneris]|uniref:Uncharacterized protein n=1 Tax=Candidozyma haemuli TaxID=45357 RepID=A0A2V1AKU2_9ASCO|nr:hypothetical protein CXQ85_001229 [[Candida] haemuloni]KAF3991872.1 hypothetical protein FT662_01489 [[Candida] haemuloni var. vulneris]KAF3993165.1 hypothetical protein FT663_01996 [[Candida] haemuloni var. vulneris]PVH18937.1 hypothetical protein CXQ85_001229 [[Candida] haemuloni]